MDRQQFISLIQEPERLGEHTLEEIKSLSERFPYCQSLQILHLLNLQQTNSVLYDEYLTSTAAHIADRKRLRELILALKSEDRETNIEVEEQPIQPAQPEQPVEPIQPTQPIQPELAEEPIQDPASSIQDPVKKDPIVPIIEDDEEERLKRLKRIVETRLKQISLEKDEMPEPDEPILSKEELIAKFIKEEPSISRPKPEFFDPVKEARSSQEDKAGLVTETLANIHIQQGNIDKAIEIYRKLSLNFPEKSAYFAAQIENLSTEN